MSIEAPPLNATQAERDTFEDNFLTYVAFMQGFRTAWRTVLGDSAASALESDVSAQDSSGAQDLTNVADPNNQFNARLQHFTNELTDLLRGARDMGMLTNPFEVVPELSGEPKRKKKEER
jgi:hypothetical protein